MNIFELKINIKETNPKKYADIAFLLDKQELLEDIQRTRKKWGLIQVIQKDSINDWKSKLYENKASKLGEFQRNIRYLLSKYKRHRGFHSALEEALLTGSVSKNSYKYIFWEKFPFNVIFNKDDEFMSYELPSITVSRQATQDDILREFREVKEYLSLKSEDVHEKYFDRFSRRRKQIDAIKEDREIYWRYLREKEKGGNIYKNLQKFTKDKFKLKYDERTLRKIIQRYKETLRL